jgi:hypothetical protein
MRAALRARDGRVENSRNDGLNQFGSGDTQCEGTKPQGIAVTQDEMEAKIDSLAEQVAMLQRQREEQRKHWQRCSLIARGAAVLLAIFTMAGGALGIASGMTSPITQIFGAVMVIALFLGHAFAQAAATLADRPQTG